MLHSWEMPGCHEILHNLNKTQIPSLKVVKKFNEDNLFLSDNFQILCSVTSIWTCNKVYFEIHVFSALNHIKYLKKLLNYIKR